MALANVHDDRFGLGPVRGLRELEALVREVPGLYVRYSAGPSFDRHERRVDTESGLPLPGLPADPLRPERWWTRPLIDWLARQLHAQRWLEERAADRCAWMLTGRTVGRGPDCKPLLADVTAIARRLLAR